MHHQNHELYLNKNKYTQKMRFAGIQLVFTKWTDCKYDYHFMFIAVAKGNKHFYAYWYTKMYIWVCNLSLFSNIARNVLQFLYVYQKNHARYHMTFVFYQHQLQALVIPISSRKEMWEQLFPFSVCHSLTVTQLTITVSISNLISAQKSKTAQAIAWV